MSKFRVRFAPSPTGPLHIGGARSALFNYLLARKNEGALVVRVEDTDLERSNREAEENIKESLRWLGIEWQEGIDIGGPHGPYRQTERMEIYQRYIAKLLESGQAYRCYCTQEELEAERQELSKRGELPRYLGKCRNLTPEQCRLLEQEGRKPVIRFKVPRGRIIQVDDLVRGKVNFESDGIGDFIIVKSDGIPTYNFAVVIDDAMMEITHIIRAEEHLSNTPRQLLIYEALGFEQPQFAHISLILGKDRSKMSKRHGATSVFQYRKLGYLPEALVNFLALLGWSPEGEEEIFDLQSLVENFSLERVAKSPAVFDLEKLNWLNGHYIRKSSVERLTELALPHLVDAGMIASEPKAEELKKIKQIVLALQQRLEYMAQIKEEAVIFFAEEIKPENEKAEKVLQQEEAPKVFKTFIAKLDELENIEPQTVKKMLKSITKELGLGGKKVFMPLRVAVTGQMHGPDLHDIVSILGREEVKNRVKKMAVSAGHSLA